MTPSLRTLAVAVAVTTAMALATLACEGGGQSLATRPTGGDADRGELAILDHGCGACHVIPGVRAARGDVGPPLAGFGRRSLIAGVVPNDPAHLVHWLRDPRAFEPHTAMPDLGLTEREARDVAAYLYTLD
jgi:cytochrome c